MNQLIQGLFNKKTTVIVAGGALAAISFWIYKSKPFTKKQITKVNIILKFNCYSFLFFLISISVFE